MSQREEPHHIEELSVDWIEHCWEDLPPREQRNQRHGRWWAHFLSELEELSDKTEVQDKNSKEIARLRINHSKSRKTSCGIKKEVSKLHHKLRKKDQENKFPQQVLGKATKKLSELYTHQLGDAYLHRLIQYEEDITILKTPLNISWRPTRR